MSIRDLWHADRSFRTEGVHLEPQDSLISKQFNNSLEEWPRTSSRVGATVELEKCLRGNWMEASIVNTLSQANSFSRVVGVDRTINVF